MGGLGWIHAQLFSTPMFSTPGRAVVSEKLKVDLR
jgi:hypothetical protein